MPDERADGAAPIGPWAEGATYADADFAFTVAAWQVLTENQHACYEANDMTNALRWGELLQQIMDRAREIIVNGDDPAWLLPRDENHEKGTGL